MHTLLQNSQARSHLMLSAFLAFGVVALQAEDVIVTACLDAGTPATLTPCPPSCCSDLGTTTTSAWISSAIPSGVTPRKSRYGVSTNATWTITPPLGTSPGAYKVYFTKGASGDCALDLMVKVVATSGCTLYDTNGVAAPSGVETPAFQQSAPANVWTPVCIVTNTSPTPSITLSVASGAYSKWYMDEVRFENLAPGTATPARITQILYGNPIVISGTGPVNHTFVLVSSTNAGRVLSQWTPEKSDMAGTGSFTFNVTPGTQKAMFFRVITQ